jgi:hypothetical protein
MDSRTGFCMEFAITENDNEDKNNNTTPSSKDELVCVDRKTCSSQNQKDFK